MSSEPGAQPCLVEVVEGWWWWCPPPPPPLLLQLSSQSLLLLPALIPDGGVGIQRGARGSLTVATSLSSDMLSSGGVWRCVAEVVLWRRCIVEAVYCGGGVLWRWCVVEVVCCGGGVVEVVYCGGGVLWRWRVMEVVCCGGGVLWRWYVAEVP